MDGTAQRKIEAVLARWVRRFLVLTLPFLVVVASAEFQELKRNQAQRRLPVVHGTVLTKRMIRVNAVAVRPELTIRLDNRQDTVIAVLNSNAASGIPQRVSFRFSGRLDEEVFLEQEHSPVTLLLLTFFPALRWNSTLLVGAIADEPEPVNEFEK